MKRRATLSLLAGLLLGVAGLVEAGAPGDSGFLSLRLPVGTREAAMGGAGVGASTGPAAVFWNPARLALEAPATDLLLQHQRLFGFFDKETALLSQGTSHGALGFLFSGLYADRMNRYDEQGVGIPLGTFQPYQVAFGVSYAHRLGERFALGGTVKVLHEEIDVYGDTGVAFDLAISHRAMIDGLWFGASITNFGPEMTIDAVPYQLPTAVRVGFGYDPVQTVFAGKVTLAGDILFPNDGNNKAHVGAEYRLTPSLALRLGYHINYESLGLTAGCGLRRGRLTVGYAYEDASNDLDPSHRVDLQVALGPER